MFSTFRVRLTAVAVLCIAISVLLVALISRGFFLSSIKSRYEEGYGSYAETLRENLDTLVETTLVANSYLLYDPEMRGVYDKIRNLGTLAEYQTVTSELDRLIGQRLLLHPNDLLDISLLTSDFIYNRSTDLVNFLTSESQDQLFDQARNTPGRFVEISTPGGFRGSRLSSGGLTFVGQVPDSNLENPPVFVILTIKPGVVLSDSDTLDVEIVDSKGESIWRFRNLLDSNVSGLAPQKVGQIDPGRQSQAYISEKDLVFYARSRSRDWIYIFLFDAEGWQDDARAYTIFLIISNMAILIGFGFLALYASYKILRPLKQLRDAAGEISANPRLKHPMGLKKVLNRFSRSSSLRTSLLLLLGGITVVAYGTSIIFAQLSARERLTTRIEASALSNLQQRKQNIRLIMSQVERQSAYLAVTASLQNIEQWGERGSVLRTEIDEVLANQRVFTEGIVSIDLYSREGSLLYTNRPGSDLRAPAPEFLATIPSVPQGNAWLPSPSGYFDPEMITFVRHIRSQNNLIDLGFLFVGLDARRVAERVGDYGSRPVSLSFVVDGQSNILAHQDRRLLGSSLDSLFTTSANSREVEISGQTYYLFRTELDRADWQLVDLVPADYVASNLEAFTVTVLLAVLPVILIMLWFIGILSRRLSSPLENMTKHIEQVSFNVLGNQTYSHSGDEIHQLASAFDTMLVRLHTLIEESFLNKIHERELEARRKAAELKALQFQINPHFLYNTFASVGFLIKLGEADSAVQMVNALTTLFRKAASSAQVITVAEEIAYVEAYLTIIRLRHNDQIRCSVSISPEIADAAILKFTLQPLIENAVIHGMLEGTGTGTIELRGSREENRILFTISDDGVGFPQERLEEIRRSLVEQEQGKAVGMTNVLERLRLYFGDIADIRIENKMERGCTVTLEIPYESQIPRSTDVQ